MKLQNDIVFLIISNLLLEASLRLRSLKEFGELVWISKVLACKLDKGVYIQILEKYVS